MAGLAALAAAPAVAQTQSDRDLSTIALSVPPDNTPTTTTLRKSEASGRAEKKTRHAHAVKSEKPAKAEATKKTAHHRNPFEDRASRYFDPLSLTLAPDTRLPSDSTTFNPVTSTYVPTDRSQIAIVPDVPVSNNVTSAGIENLGQGRNVTVVVPLFKILNNLSPGPAPE